MPTSNDDVIRQRAYQLWEADGRPDGRSEHYWHIASTEAAKPAKAGKTAAIKTALKKSEGKDPAPKNAAKKAEAPAKKAATKPRAAVPAKKSGKKG